ncbi:MAG TPA: alpha-glucosidase [Terriglobales bacterium]|nr:alpha-glucosidase [Terriglobales bacterium]
MRIRFALAAVLALATLPLPAQSKPAGNNESHTWWKSAVFYELYPRSFGDSNGDGVGDLNGITAHLDYLKQLGVDAIWITPCFPSPQVDFGYDVSDYENIDPMYGTLKDFDRMQQEAKKRGIRIILDLVVNHTSDQHAWFKDSRSSRTSAKRDWYIWRDGRGPAQPPNNWTSTFGGSAWQWDNTSKQWYYHYFYIQQPDLNWRNPAVKQAIYDTSAWWYQRGVAGFRLDAVDTLYEDPKLTDNPILPGKNAYGDPNENEIHNKKLPEVHDALKGLREVADKYNAVLIGETWTSNIDELKAYYGQHNNELQMPMDFMFMKVDKLSPPEFRKQIDAIEGSGGWPVFVISNHDNVRSYNRYGDGAHNDAIAKLMGAFYLTLRGSPIMYYGEELGMENNDPKRKEDVRDPIGRTGWPKEKGRDGERTPMQWNTASNAGFTTGKPWLPVPSSYKTHNVASELKDPNSVLSIYKKVLGLRHTDAALTNGDYVALNTSDEHVMSYLRRYQGRAVLVVLNMSAQPQKTAFDLASQGVQAARARTLVTTAGKPASVELKSISLQPFEVFIGEVGGK